MTLHTTTGAKQMLCLLSHLLTNKSVTLLIITIETKQGNHRHQTSPPVLPPGEQDKTWHRVWFCSIGATMWKHDASHKNRKYITLSSVKPRLQLTCTEISWSLDVWFLRYANGQTDMETRWSHYFASLPWPK